MSLTRSDFEAICESDLVELIKGSVPESLHLEYKRDSYGSRDAEKRELLKDVSAFANANGGHIVIGIEEDKGVASKLCVIKTDNIDQEVSRIDEIIRTGIEPRVPSCRVRAIPLSSQSFQVIVIRIPRSWRTPHRVCAQNSNRYWIRNSSGAHEASMDELRTIFTLSDSAIKYAQAFRTERIKLLTDTHSIDGNGRFIFHIIPLSAVSTTTTLDTKNIYEQRMAFQPIAYMGLMGLSTRYNFEGVINVRSAGANKGYTQLFRNGIVEATLANLIFTPYEGRYVIGGLQFEANFFKVFSNYINGLKTLGIEPPLVLMLSFENVKGAYYSTLREKESLVIPFDRDAICLPECIIEEYGDNASYHRAIKPAFDALWNTVGFSESQFFDKDSGLWNGH